MHRIAFAAALLVGSLVTIPAFAADPLVVQPLAGEGAGRHRHQGPGDQPDSPVAARGADQADHQRHASRPSRSTGPTKDKNTGTAMLICPGGGYWDLYWELEGEEVAAWLNSLGMTGHHPQVPLPAASRRGQGRAAARPAARRPAGRPPGPQPGGGMGHRPEADRHGRLLGGRPSRRWRPPPASRSGCMNRSTPSTPSVAGPTSPSRAIRAT